MRQGRVAILDSRFAIQNGNQPLLLLGAADDLVRELSRFLLAHRVRRDGSAQAKDAEVHWR